MLLKAIPDAEILVVRFLLCVVAEWYILQQKCLKKQIGSAVLGTWWHNFRPSTLTLTVQSITDRQTRRCQCHAKSQSYWIILCAAAPLAESLKSSSTW